MRMLAVCLLSLSMLPGCAGGKNYLINRSADLVDILRGHVMFGPGVALNLEATRLLSLGGTYEHNVWAAGLGNRAVGTWRESVWAWGLLVGYHHEGPVTGDFKQISGSYGWNFMNDEAGVFQEAPGANNLDLLTCRGTLMLFVGIDLEVRVGEVLDFIAGLFQFDPSGDDRDYSSMRTPNEPAPTPAADDKPAAGANEVPVSK